MFILLSALLTHGLAGAAGSDEQAQPALIRARIEQIQRAALRAPDAAGSIAADNLAVFYAQRDHAPAWDDESRRARLISALEGLADDGLEPNDYLIEQLRRFPGTVAHDASRRACADLMATAAYLQALSHLAHGRLDPAAVEPLWRFEPSRDDVVNEILLLHAQADLDDPARAFDRTRPSTTLYRNLQRGLARFHAMAAQGEWVSIPAGRSLRPGAVDPRVPLLRTRLSVPGDTSSTITDADRYDDVLVDAVMRFQRRHHLEVDGIVGAATLAALNVPLAARIEQIRVNLERARWLASITDALSEYVLVDVAGAMISFRRDGETIWSARTQVGRASRPTPLLKSEITHFTFNPTWTVPPTILRKDKLPEIRRDIEYLARNRIRVIDYSGNELDPAFIDWNDPGAVLLRQDAGPDNALGRVAIRFPNPFAVYLHDTPSQRLFQRDQRTFSSGCVRVERAMELVDLLIDSSHSIDRTRVDEIIESGETRNVSLARPVPILIAYWTAEADADGEVRFRNDIYAHDDALVRALSATAPLDEIIVSCNPAH